LYLFANERAIRSILVQDFEGKEWAYTSYVENSWMHKQGIQVWKDCVCAYINLLYEIEALLFSCWVHFGLQRWCG
jgi:hypothetical protein